MRPFSSWHYDRLDGRGFFGKPLVLLPVEQVRGNSKHNGNTPEQKLKTEET